MSSFPSEEKSEHRNKMLTGLDTSNRDESIGSLSKSVGSEVLELSEEEKAEEEADGELVRSFSSTFSSDGDFWLLPSLLHEQK